MSFLPFLTVPPARGANNSGKMSEMAEMDLWRHLRVRLAGEANEAQADAAESVDSGPN